VAHGLHLRDVHQIVKACCPADRWRKLSIKPTAAEDYRTGRWQSDVTIYIEIDDQRPTFELFKTAVQGVLGNAHTNWNKITTTKQQNGEGASEYGERLFQIYQECSGTNKHDRGDRAFTQAFKYGLSPTHQTILKMGMLALAEYDPLVEWACGI